LLRRQNLSAYSGTASETLFKLMNEFAAENILLFSDKKIEIMNAKKLAHVIEGQQ
jgi:CRP-like cAMP-binding protein